MPSTHSNSAGGGSGWINSYQSNISALYTQTACDVTITLLDQFGTALPAIFAGAGHVDERFDNVSGTSELTFPTTQTPILYPTGSIRSDGTILDRTGGDQSFVGYTLSTQDQASWVAGTYHVTLPNGDNGYNMFQIAFHGTTLQKIGDQTLWVWGTALSNTTNRTLTVTTNHPPTSSATH